MKLFYDPCTGESYYAKDIPLEKIEKISKEIRELKIKDLSEKIIKTIIRYDEEIYLIAKNYLRKLDSEDRTYVKYSLLRKKVRGFKFRNENYPLNNFTYLDVINKFGENPICCFTGRIIDYEINDYSLDHIIPASKGGSNELDNLAICDMDFNYLKGNLSKKELINMVKPFLIKCGYKIIPPNNP